MASRIRMRLQQLIDAPLARAVVASSALHAALFALSVEHPRFVGSGRLEERNAVPYSVARAARPSLDVDFRQDHEGRERAEAGWDSQPAAYAPTHTPQLLANTASTRRTPGNGAAPGDRSTPDRGGGSDCWVNGFRFCSSGG